MLNRKNPKKTIATFLLVAAASLVLTGCYKHYYFPVEIGELTVSPIYRLEIQNDSTQVLTFLPRDGAEEKFEEKQIAVGENFTTLLQIKKIIVGETTTREVVTGPYIDSGRLGPDTAYIRYKDARRPREFVIDLESDSWFGTYETIAKRPEPLPKTLKVHLTDQNLSKPKWFRGGPDQP
ncbi:MAG: hypothetical protein JSW26_07740 [Desulfobacterales bacterium]|nr:MAG: hypothetical protein JSW26_07740 [Desulfobacterales bacterium]